MLSILNRILATLIFFITSSSLALASEGQTYGGPVGGTDLGNAYLTSAVGFYGGSDSSLPKLVSAVTSRFPNLKLPYAYAPPFRQLTLEEDESVVRAINDAAVRILFVGIGGSLQDHWMHAHQGRIQSVMLGVGAAFDFLARTKPQAPRWMQQSGLEWLFRLGAEPRRLDVQGADLPGVHYLRTIDDVAAIAAAIGGGGRVGVIG